MELGADRYMLRTHSVLGIRRVEGDTASGKIERNVLSSLKNNSIRE
jgi:hypothetical protein